MRSAMIAICGAHSSKHETRVTVNILPHFLVQFSIKLPSCDASPSANYVTFDMFQAQWLPRFCRQPTLCRAEVAGVRFRSLADTQATYDER